MCAVSAPLIFGSIWLFSCWLLNLKAIKEPLYNSEILSRTFKRIRKLAMDVQGNYSEAINLVQVYLFI